MAGSTSAVGNSADSAGAGLAGAGVAPRGGVAGRTALLCGVLAPPAVGAAACALTALMANAIAATPAQIHALMPIPSIVRLRMMTERK
jgi:hypothetical protein